MKCEFVESSYTKIKDFCHEHIEKGMFSHFEILDSAFYNNSGFYLVKHPNQSSPSYENWLNAAEPKYGKCEILIISTQNHKHTPKTRLWNVSIEREHELKNPVYNCPKRMLDKSENDVRAAVNWRTECYAKHDKINEHRTKLRAKFKLVGSLTRGLVINTELYGAIIFEHCFEGERNVLIGYQAKAPTKRIQFQIGLITEEELKAALICNTQIPDVSNTKS